jgi:hypothetical protein
MESSHTCRNTTSPDSLVVVETLPHTTFDTVTAPHLLDGTSSVAVEPNFTRHLDLLGQVNVQFWG